MFTWQDKYQWNFSDAGPTVPDQGPAITGAQIFRGGHFKNVVRETIQNSLDAKDRTLPEDVPVRVEYELMYLDRSEVPGAEDLSRVIDLCHDYISSMEDIKLDDINSLRDANQRLLKSERIAVLRISDFMTEGLTPKNYTRLMNNEGLTSKTDGESAGSFGFGKFAPYLLSPVNTILYSTLTKDEGYKFIGRSLLSTFVQDGKKKMGISLFGALSDSRDSILPIDSTDFVPPAFRRDSNGTDVYILCFDRTDDWMDQTAFSALENFFYAIWQKKVTVVLKEGNRRVEFNSDNVGDMIRQYNDIYHDKYEREENNFTFTAPVFWNVIEKSLSDGPIVNPDFRHKGEVLLYLAMGEDIDGRAVLRMRNSGMKIDIERRYDGLPSFNAVLVATGAGRYEEDYTGNISKFLRELETAAHDNWAIENTKKPAIVQEAKLVLRDLHRFVREEVKKKVPQDDGTPMDVFGLNRILPNVVEEGSEQIKEDAVFNFVPISTGLKDSDRKKKNEPIKRKINGRGKKPDPNPQPRPDPDPDRVKRHRDNHQREKIVAVPLQLTEVKTPYLQDRNSYRISVIPGSSASMMLLQIRISGDDSAMFDIGVSNVQSGSRHYAIKDDYIQIPNVKAGARYTCDVTLSERGRYALEVKAYAKK